MNDDNLFVNPCTGEVIDKRDYIEKAAVQRQKEGYKKYLAKGRRNPFYWGNMLNIEDLLKQSNITLTMLGGILVLGCYINFDNTLICKADKNKTPYKREEIKNILGMKETTFKNFISKCRSIGILIVESTDRGIVYRFNNKYHFVGDNKDKVESRKMVRIYKEGIQAMIKSGLKLEDIGFLYLVLPYVDYSSCTIVEDPFAEFPVPLTCQEIGEKLGLTRPTLNKYLTMCFEYSFGKDERRDKYLLRVFGKFDGGKKAYCINPIILRRCATLKGVIEYSQLDKMFKVTGKKISRQKAIT